MQRVQQLAELIGPNVYLQATIIAVAFLLIGKIADWIISGIVGRIAKRSTNDFDDGLIELVHRPIFLSFVLIGLGIATRRLGLAESPTFVTLNILQTIAIVVWYNALGALANHVRERKSSDYLATAVARKLSLAELEREYIERVLEDEGGNKTRTSQLLGLDRKTLYRKLDEYARADAKKDAKNAEDKDS